MSSRRSRPTRPPWSTSRSMRAPSTRSWSRKAPRTCRSINLIAVLAAEGEDAKAAAAGRAGYRPPPSLPAAAAGQAGLRREASPQAAKPALRSLTTGPPPVPSRSPRRAKNDRAGSRAEGHGSKVAVSSPGVGAAAGKGGGDRLTRMQGSGRIGRHARYRGAAIGQRACNPRALRRLHRPDQAPSGQDPCAVRAGSYELIPHDTIRR